MNSEIIRLTPARIKIRGRPLSVRAPDAAPLSLRRFRASLKRRLAQWALDHDTTLEAAFNIAVEEGLRALEQSRGGNA